MAAIRKKLLFELAGHDPSAKACYLLHSEKSPCDPERFAVGPEMVSQEVIFNPVLQIHCLEHQALFDVRRHTVTAGAKLDPIDQAKGGWIRFPPYPVFLYRMAFHPVPDEIKAGGPVDPLLVKVIEVVKIVLPEM
jgi:hypothetical protein